MFRKLALTAAITGFVTVPAGAADIDDGSQLVQPTEYHQHWGVLEFGAGVFSGDESGTWDDGNETYDETWNGHSIWAAGSFVWLPSSFYAIQIDAWANKNAVSWSETYTEGCCVGTDGGDWTEKYVGITGSLRRITAKGQFGVWGEFTKEVGDNAAWGTIGLEGQHNYGPWSFYGNVGYEHGISGYAADDNEHEVFAIGEVTHYYNPNLAVSGRLRVSSFGEEDGSYSLSGTGVGWRATLEYKHDDKPVSVFTSYDGEAWSASDNDPDSWSGTEHELWVGVRFFLRDGTLQEINQNVF